MSLEDGVPFEGPATMRNETINDLFRHMEWADALLWSVVLGSDPGLVRNEELLRRLRHIHRTQSAFLHVWRGEVVDFASSPGLEASPLLDFARNLGMDVRMFVESVDEARLAEVVELPWSRHFGEISGFDPAPTTLFDTFYQLCAHGVHHRAQINSLLRELGLTPPLIDYIGWAWQGRPEAVWPATPSDPQH